MKLQKILAGCQHYCYYYYYYLKYENLIKEQQKLYEKVIFLYLAICSLSVFSESASDFIEMLKDLKFDEKCKEYFVRKIINNYACIKSFYYTFC